MKKYKRHNICGTLSPAKKKYTIIIPAANMGRRMKSYGPKSLIKIHSSCTILDNQINIINQVFKNNCEIFIIVGFEKEKFNTKKRNVKLLENDDYKEKNILKSISIGLEEATTDNVLLIYGDLVFNLETLKAPFGYYSMLLIDRFGLIANKEIGCTIDNNIVNQLMYDLPNKWAQIAFFTDYELEALHRICKQPENHMKFGFEAINMIIEQEGIFAACSPKGMKITDIDSSKDFVKIKEII